MHQARLIPRPAFLRPATIKPAQLAAGACDHEFQNYRKPVRWYRLEWKLGHTYGFVHIIRACTRCGSRTTIGMVRMTYAEIAALPQPEAQRLAFKCINAMYRSLTKAGRI